MAKMFVALLAAYVATVSAQPVAVLLQEAGSSNGQPGGVRVRAPAPNSASNPRAAESRARAVRPSSNVNPAFAANLLEEASSYVR